MEKLLVPKLRFPEFQEVWHSKTLSDISNKVGYGIGSSAVQFDGVNKYLRITDIDESSNKFLPKPLTSPEGEISNKYYLKEGDIVFARTGASVGKSYIYDEKDGVIVYAGFLIKFSINKAEPKFIFYNTLTSQYWKWVQVMSMRSGQPGLNAEELKSFIINLPSLPEQQKIASFLTDVDDKITKLTKKKKLLEQYKKGIMQKIFNQELRFKDDNGNEFPKWEEKKLGEVATKKSSNISANTIEENSGEFKIYGASGLLKKIDFYREEEPYISIVKDGAGVGRTLLCDPFSSVLGTLDIIKPKKGVNLYFIYCLLNNINFLKFITGSTIPHIYFKDYSTVKIEIPCLDEQIKIANFLSDIDFKIEALNSKIENCKTFKKGLLQKMFI